MTEHAEKTALVLRIDVTLLDEFGVVWSDHKK